LFESSWNKAFYIWNSDLRDGCIGPN